MSRDFADQRIRLADGYAVLKYPYSITPRECVQLAVFFLAQAGVRALPAIKYVQWWMRREIA